MNKYAQIYIDTLQEKIAAVENRYVRPEDQIDAVAGRAIGAGVDAAGRGIEAGKTMAVDAGNAVAGAATAAGQGIQAGVNAGARNFVNNTRDAGNAIAGAASDARNTVQNAVGDTVVAGQKVLNGAPGYFSRIGDSIQNKAHQPDIDSAMSTKPSLLANAGK